MNKLHYGDNLKKYLVLITLIGVHLFSTNNLICGERIHLSPLEKNTLGWIYQRSGFPRDFNFIIRREATVDDKNLVELGIKKVIVYTRPSDNSVSLVYFVDEKELIRMAGIKFLEGTPEYSIYIRTLLSDFGINEATFGKYYPLGFIQGTVMQNLSRNEKIIMDAWGNAYLVDCWRHEKTFEVFISKDYSGKENIDESLRAFFEWKGIKARQEKGR